MQQRRLEYPCAGCKKECLSELSGTYILVFAGPASVILASLFPENLQGVPTTAFIALIFGTAVALSIMIFGRTSGSIINPALTLSATSANLLKRNLTIPYLSFQILGGLLAGLTLRLIFGSTTSSNLGSTKLAEGINPLFGITLEAIGTFLLASSALIASTKIKRLPIQALIVSSTLFVLIMFIGPLTGAGFNPARSLGPSVASSYFQNLYVYVVGPVIGALMAGLIFRILKENGKRKQSGNIVCMC